MNKLDIIMMEPEFRPGGFVYKHVHNSKVDPIRAAQSAVDRMRELHDIEDHEFGQLCEQVLRKLLSTE